MRTLGILLAVATSGAAWAATAQEAVDPLLAAATSDPLELARVVDRIGDAAVLERLGEERPAGLRLVAIHACRGMDAPESALEVLATIAAGRDPDLAPAAMMAILGIVLAMDPQELDGREVLRSDLAAGRAAIALVAADESARADIRRAATIAGETLAQLGVP